MNVTLPNGIVIENASLEDITALLAATNLTAPAVPAQPKADGRNHAARKHNYEARIARREDPTRKGGAGLKKAEKQAIARKLEAENGGSYTTRQWNAACKVARGL